jgi:hypothetical protein
MKRVLFAVLCAVVMPLAAQDKPQPPAPHFTLWATSYCYSWGDPLGYTWTQCEQPVRVVTVERVVERVVEKPVPVPAPEKAPEPKPKLRG